MPELLAATLSRGWRAVVLCAGEERLRDLDDHLWTYHDSAFLPHGTAKDGRAERQPIWLTLEDERPNEANVCFLVDGADTSRATDYERVIRIFDGRDEEAIAGARAAWKSAKAVGHEVTYWQEGESGRFEKAG